MDLVIFQFDLLIVTNSTLMQDVNNKGKLCKYEEEVETILCPQFL